MEELLTMYISEPNTAILLHKFFIYDNENYEVTKIEKTWGEIPCFLAYIKARNTNTNKEKRFLSKCLPNIQSKKENDKWKISISIL